jgi:hypothetical protein
VIVVVITAPKEMQTDMVAELALQVLLCLVEALS